MQGQSNPTRWDDKSRLHAYLMARSQSLHRACPGAVLGLHAHQPLDRQQALCGRIPPPPPRRRQTGQRGWAKCGGWCAGVNVAVCAALRARQRTRSALQRARAGRCDWRRACDAGQASYAPSTSCSLSALSSACSGASSAPVSAPAAGTGEPGGAPASFTRLITRGRPAAAAGWFVCPSDRLPLVVAPPSSPASAPVSPTASSASTQGWVLFWWKGKPSGTSGWRWAIRWCGQLRVRASGPVAGVSLLPTAWSRTRCQPRGRPSGSVAPARAADRLGFAQFDG